jgi:hypothetical protein
MGLARNPSLTESSTDSGVTSASGITEETNVRWKCRFIRFCQQKLGQSPRIAGPTAITAYFDYLALERNMAPDTQKQALNESVNVFGIAEFTLDQISQACGQRRPPVVMTRDEIRSVFARLEDPCPTINTSRNCLSARAMSNRYSGPLKLKMDLNPAAASGRPWTSDWPMRVQRWIR